MPSQPTPTQVALPMDMVLLLGEIKGTVENGFANLERGQADLRKDLTAIREDHEGRLDDLEARWAGLEKERAQQVPLFQESLARLDKIEETLAQGRGMFAGVKGVWVVVAAGVTFLGGAGMGKVIENALHPMGVAKTEVKVEHTAPVTGNHR